jgi:hypothetical protein
MAFHGIDLPEPIEFLDLAHGVSIVLRIDRYEMGTTQIHPTVVTPRHVRLHMEQNGLTAAPPAGHPITVRIPVLRVWGERLDEPSPLHYWDISSKRLTADLQPRLYAAAGRPVTVKLTANGYKPVKTYSVEVGG